MLPNLLNYKWQSSWTTRGKEQASEINKLMRRKSSGHTHTTAALTALGESDPRAGQLLETSCLFEPHVKAILDLMASHFWPDPEDGGSRTVCYGLRGNINTPSITSIAGPRARRPEGPAPNPSVVDISYFCLSSIHSLCSSPDSLLSKSPCVGVV